MTMPFDFIQFLETKTRYLQTDFTNLKHLTEELELALKEKQSAHVRRIVRNVK